MQKFTDIFIHRPVLATVVSLLILVFGIRAVYDLQIRQYPEVDSTTITVSTSYAGADAELVEGFITTPIQKAIASADGVDYLTATSSEGLSQIQAHLTLNADPQIAFTDIMSKMAQIRGELPRESEDPIIVGASEQASAVMYLSFNSETMQAEQITDYVERVVQPKIETVQGVAEAQVNGSGTFAMRVWLNPEQMAAYDISPSEVSDALSQNHYQSAAGRTKGEYTAISITADTDLHSVDEFANIVVKNEGGSVVRIRDVARVELGSESYDNTVIFDGKQATFVAVTLTPTANPLTVIDGVRDIFPSIVRDLPPSLNGDIVYDATEFIRASIKEVFKTIIEATIIVIVVIFLFLGSMRAVTIPIITIPLSLIGVCSLLLALGYSINLMTLMAMVLAIGLVVDDAIIVLENIHRHIEEGAKPFQAALSGAREIAFPIIAMTITLAAVYAPIAFMDGLVGALFKEFAFTLAMAVIISGVIALTLSPMMCSKLMKNTSSSPRFAHYLDQRFNTLKNVYKRSLQHVLLHRPTVVIFIIAVLACSAYLYINTQKETAPTEDRGFFIVSAAAPDHTTLDYLTTFTDTFGDIFNDYPEMEHYFVINNSNQAFSGMVLAPWDQRDRKQQALTPLLQQQLDQIAGLRSIAIIPAALPGTGGGGTPVRFVITSTNDYEAIFPVAEQLAETARNSGLFAYVNNSLKFNRPQIEVLVDRDKAGDLGINMQDIGTTLARSLSEGYVSRFSLQSRSYKVIPQIERDFRLRAEQLGNLYISTASGDTIPLSTIISLQESTQPNQRTQFQQLNAATIEGVMAPGYSLGDGLAFLENEANQMFPEGTTYDYDGQSRQFMQEGNVLMVAFFFSMIVIFLVLAAQYESFRDPLIILISVPMSIFGALIPLNLGLGSINIYTQIGLITLIGVISKHGILMVDFANHLQAEKGLSIKEAIEEAASVRLRPILMTTAAMVFGVIPLLLATGAGASSRFAIGLVISTGLSIGTLFTLFVVPAMYTFLARDHREQIIEGAVADAQ